MNKGKKPTPKPPSTEQQRDRPSHAKALKPPAEQDARKLLHELRVHQVELEMQNEELRNARVEVEVALARYTEIFDFAPIGYATIMADSIILEINHAGAQLLGTARSSLSGRNLRSLVYAGHHAAFDEMISAAQASGSKQSATVELLRQPNQRFPARLSVLMLPRGQTALLVAFEDISELDRHRQELEQTDQALREADRRKDEFLALLSHELRNPLAPIKTSLFVLEHAPLESDAAQRAHQVIDRQVTQLTRLIDDLLDVTRIGRGKVRLELLPVELSELAGRAAEDQRAAFDAAGVTLRVEQSLPLWVSGDAARLTQVVSNLLSNALKFTRRGGQVQLSSSQVQGRAVLRVSDTGVGIAADLLEHVFEPFVQSPQTLDRSDGGLGLGLALVRGLVELHGGEVGVRSGGVGMGAELTICLPVTAAPAQDRAETVAVPVRRRRVLVIEDNADAAEMLQAALSLSGHEVRSALDGPQGLALAASFDPEIVICDLGLPGMDGFQVARALRAREVSRSILLVALTGYARVEDLERTRAAGFDVHLPKPASVAMLERVIAAAAL